jgi:hypothetical protein
LNEVGDVLHPYRLLYSVYSAIKTDTPVFLF